MKYIPRISFKGLLEQKMRPYRQRTFKFSSRRKRMGVLKKIRPFMTRSPRVRANEVVRLRNLLRMTSSLFGGRFTGNPSIVDPERPLLYQQDAEVYFLGTDKRVLWSAYIRTAREEFWNETGERAKARVSAMLSKEEQRQRSSLRFQPIEYNAWGQPTSFILMEHEERYPQFGDLTYNQYREQVEKEIITSGPPEIYESFTIDEKYEYGIGLFAVVDAESISRETIEQVIDRFLENGETDWRSETPVPRSKLPFETEMETMKTIPLEKR